MTLTSPAAVAAAADRLSRDSPGYLERVRAATGRLRARPGVLTDPRLALEALGDVADINVDVPTASSRPGVSLLKSAIRKLIGWYLNYLGAQVTVLGQAVSRLGTALVERTEELGDDHERLARQVAGLADRVERLEKERDAAR